MRLVNFSAPGSPDRPGLVVGDSVRPLYSNSVAAVLEALALGGVVDEDAAGASIQLTEVALRPPLRPAVVVAPGPAPHGPDGSLERHREFYLKSSHAIIGPADVVPYRDALGTLSYRAQLGLVLRATPRHTPAERILDGLLGAVVVADLMSIDLLRPAWEGTMWHTRYGEGGSFDGSCPMSATFVTADEIDLAAVRLADAAGDAAVDVGAVAEQLAYVSRWMALGPDVLLLVGSPHGPRFGRSPTGEPTIDFPNDEPRLFPGDRAWVRSAIGSVDALIEPAAGRS